MTGELLCVLRGPTYEVRRESAGDKWCFGCRARLPHDLVMWDEPPGVMTYYEPVVVYECSRCTQDRTQFPASTSW